MIDDVALIARREQSSITTPVSMLHFGGAQDPNRLTDGRWRRSAQVSACLCSSRHLLMTTPASDLQSWPPPAPAPAPAPPSHLPPIDIGAGLPTVLLTLNSVGYGQNAINRQPAELSRVSFWRSPLFLFFARRLSFRLRPQPNRKLHGFHEALPRRHQSRWLKIEQQAQRQRNRGK